ncbi:hypothetical protein PIB30_042616 [Stylosanthes scabra]|uniref:Uncharacterized protein n=1 Tax=Stylosanthes scabra TaxID=79078 RepID=A0ABU6XGR8_9FABA|nr:hypothetical protein [Stylosanthes scabra]
MLTSIGGSRIPWVTRSSSLTDSTVSSATPRPKRHCDLPHEDDHSDGSRPRSSCMRATAYLHLFARGASSQEVVRQTDRVRSVPELPVLIHGSASHTLRSFVSTSEGPAEASLSASLGAVKMSQGSGLRKFMEKSSSSSFVEPGEWTDYASMHTLCDLDDCE